MRFDSSFQITAGEMDTPHNEHMHKRQPLVLKKLQWKKRVGCELQTPGSSQVESSANDVDHKDVVSTKQLSAPTNSIDDPSSTKRPASRDDSRFILIKLN